MDESACVMATFDKANQSFAVGIEINSMSLNTILSGRDLELLGVSILDCWHTESGAHVTYHYSRFALEISVNFEVNERRNYPRFVSESEIHQHS